MTLRRALGLLVGLVTVGMVVPAAIDAVRNPPEPERETWKDAARWER